MLFGQFHVGKLWIGFSLTIFGPNIPKYQKLGWKCWHWLQTHIRLSPKILTKGCLLPKNELLSPRCSQTFTCRVCISTFLLNKLDSAFCKVPMKNMWGNNHHNRSRRPSFILRLRREFLSNWHSVWCILRHTPPLQLSSSVANWPKRNTTEVRWNIFRGFQTLQ